MTTSFLKRLAGETAIYGFTSALTRSASFLLVPLYMSVLTPSDYGVIGIVDAVAALINCAATLGLDSASSRWFYDTEDVIDRRRTIATWFWTQLAVSSGTAACLVAGSHAAAGICLDAEGCGRIVVLAALAIPPIATTIVLQNLLRFRRQAKLAAGFNVASTLTTMALIAFAVLFLRTGLEGVYTARLVAAVISALAAIVLLNTWVSPTAFSVPRLREMLAFGLPLLPVTFGIWTMSSFNRLILSSSWSLRQTGLYTVAGSVASGAQLATGAFTQAWWPCAFSIYKQPGSRHFYARVLDLYAFFGCLLGCCLAVFALPLFQLLATESYHEAAPCVALLGFAHFLEGARYIGWFGSAVAKKSWPLTTAVAAGTFVNIGATFALVPQWGAEGAAAAVLLGYLTCVTLLFAIGQRFTPIPFRWRVSLACLLTAGTVVVVDRVWVMQSGPLAVPLKVALLLVFVPLGAALGLFRGLASSGDSQMAALVEGGSDAPRQAA